MCEAAQRTEGLCGDRLLMRNKWEQKLMTSYSGPFWGVTTINQ